MPNGSRFETSGLTCPQCEKHSTEVMPEDACLHSFRCPHCQTLLRPKPGDCCVFCSFGDRPCPPRQREMTRDLRADWKKVHGAGEPAQASWYQAIPQLSLNWILATGVSKNAPVIDVGGGGSTLVDHLLVEGFTDITVLDIAPEALATAEARLGVRAAHVRWVAADVTLWRPGRRYELWHDRAVLHFAVTPSAQASYVEVLRRALAPGGHVLIATFGPDGPAQCSGLSVKRYSADEIDLLLGPTFRRVRWQVENHVTPAGRVQQFLHGWWRADV